MPEEKKRYLSASGSKLPRASELDTDIFHRIKPLLQEATALRVRMSADEDRLGEIRNELASICEALELKGFKHGMAGFEYHGYTSRQTLSKEKLAERVPADVIAECYETGTPYLVTKFLAFDVE